MSRRVIWKYTLDITDEQEVDMPFVCKFRHVAPTNLSHPDKPFNERLLGERINVWTEVEPETEVRPHKFYVVGTGHSVPEGSIFVGTAPMPSGLVWHVFWSVIL